MTWDFDYAVKVAIMVFPFIALLLTIPFLVLQYFRYGATHWWKSVTVFSLIFYLMVALFTVVLPLPSRDSVAQMTGPYMQLQPFHFLTQFKDHGLRTQGISAWVVFMQTQTFQQVFFNVLLMVPLGIYLRYYFKLSFFVTILLTFVLSLSFELVQLSGLLGFYARPYRLFDVDDLLLNTMGGGLGYLIAPLFMLIIPSRDDMDASQIKRAGQVTLMRRMVANFLDFALLGVISFVLVYFVYDAPAVRKYLLDPKSLIKLIVSRHILFAIPIAVAMVYFTWLPWIASGFTLGKRLVNIRLESLKGAQIKYVPLLLRYSFIAMTFIVLYLCATQLIAIRRINTENLNGILSAILVLMIMGFALLIDACYAFASNLPLVYERISGLVNVSSISDDIDGTKQ